jgi:acyl-coenzyme A synthetase/AMP-(fatty) acid ligase
MPGGLDVPPYVTVGEDGPASPEESRPLHRFPDTIGGLYDLGMRHHRRAAVLLRAAGDGFEGIPDWRFDRLVIRLALYARERLRLGSGDRVVVLGRLAWLWPVADLAAIGTGAVPVGLEHDLSDAALAGALRDATPRLSIATDTVSAERLLQARAPRPAP